MSNSIALQVDRGNIRHTRLAELPAAVLSEGQVRIAIDRFALTANNVTYAVAGDSIGYWQFYPAEDNWGHVPCWGMANVVESAHADIPVGDRLYGFLPMAGQAVLTLDRVTAEQATEVSPWRSDLPGTYNHYRRTRAEPRALQDMEDQRCIFFPLFATSYLLYDFLMDNSLFGASTVLIGSASSKTALGLARLLRDDATCAARVVGLTSAGNVDFLRSLDAYHGVCVYGDETSLDANVAAAYVDMSGDAGLTERLHRHYRDQLRLSLAVGATHWENFGASTVLPGPKPEFFFAPAQISKRDAEWGRGEVMRRATAAVMQLASQMSGQIEICYITDAPALQDAWLSLVDNQIPPTQALIAALPG
ncbi:MAG: DUF2855 family protein [Halieaceae bacterium]|jgi:hypothetical protein|nr:DUF2855 family protein [Halieaceae bacterium]